MPSRQVAQPVFSVTQPHSSTTYATIKKTRRDRKQHKDSFGSTQPRFRTQKQVDVDEDPQSRTELTIGKENSGQGSRVPLKKRRRAEMGRKRVGRQENEEDSRPLCYA